MNAVSESPNLKSAEVNPHYLKRVVQLSDHRDVIASEDIYDEHGLKLIAKGSRVDHSTHERLIRFKLRKPLETTVAIEDGVNSGHLSKIAQELVARNPLIALAQVNKDHRLRIHNTLSRIHFDPPSTLLLSLLQQETHRMEHAMLVALLASGIGTEMKLDEARLEELMIAAILHDIGELYMAPDTHADAEHPSHDQWRQIAAHAVVGEMVLQETTRVPASVARAVGEHHERCSGFGYPKQLKDNDISAAGKILQAAEMLSDLVSYPDCDPLRIDHALTIVLSDFARTIVDVVISANFHPQGMDATEAFDFAPICLRAQTLLQRIDSTIAWIEENPHLESAEQALANTARDRLKMLQSALHSTGICAIGACLEKTANLTHSERIELETTVEELSCRLRELGQLITLRAHASGHERSGFVTGLYQRLEEQPSSASD